MKRNNLRGKRRLSKQKTQINFEQHALFRCPGPKVLARLLQCSLRNLERLANCKDGYKIWTLRQGLNERVIEEPNSALHNVHIRLGNLLRRLSTPDYLHSGVAGRSIRSNAEAHCQYSETIKLDIKKFYPSTLAAHVFELFHIDFEMSRDSAGLLAKICTYDGHVPTGSSISQLLSFWAHRKLFDAVYDYARTRSGTFTLYVDDLTLSFRSVSPNDIRSLTRLISKRGLTAHKAKLYRPSQTRVVTGTAIKGQRLIVTNSLNLRISKAHVEFRQAVTDAARLSSARTLAGRLNAAAFIDKSVLNKARGAQGFLKSLNRSKDRYNS